MKTRHVLLPWWFGGLLLMLGCASEAPRTVQIICKETPAYSSRWGSESTSSVLLGNSFQVTSVPLSGRLRITGARGDTGTERFLEARCVAPFPLQGQARWIQVRTPAPSGPGWEMGDEVEAFTVNELWVPSGQTAVLSKGSVVGFIPTAALGEKPPPRESYIQTLRTQLASNAFDQALALTRRATGFFPQEALFHRLLGHLVTHQGGNPPKPPKTLPKLTALPDVFPTPPLTLSEGEELHEQHPTPVFVTAVGLRLREAPESSAKVLATLNVNQPLGLYSIDEDWAWVRFELGQQVRMDYDGSFMGYVDAEPIKGYVSRRFLGRAPLDAGQLLAGGQEALQAGRSAEAIVLLHRALEAMPDSKLEPTNAAYTGLIQASFDNERFENLFQAIASRQQTKAAPTVRTKPPYPLVLMGCHGDLAQATILDLRDTKTDAWAGLGALAAAMKMPDVCVASVDTRAPLEPHNDDFCEEAGEENCEPRPALFAARAMYEKTVLPEYEKWIHKVELYFGPPAYFHFEPRQLGSLAPGKKVVFYNLPLDGDASEEGVSCVKPRKDVASVVVLDLPVLNDWNQLQVWIELPDYLDSEFGLALADNAEQVSEWIQKREDCFWFESFRVPGGKPTQGETKATFPLVRRASLTSAQPVPWWSNLR